MKILYIFSFRSNLKTWKSSGALNREFLYFKKFYENYKTKHLLFTYGGFEDLDIVKDKNLTVYPLFAFFKFTNNKFKTFFLSLIYPFKTRKNFIDIYIIKVNQLSGVLVGTIFSIILKKPLYVRTGYDAYLFSVNDKKNIFKRIYFLLLTQISLIACDIYSVTSQSDYKYIKNTYFFNSKKLILRPNWVLNSESEDIKIRKKDCILSVGRLEPQKNYHYLINEVADTGFKLKIIGSGSLKAELLSLAKEKKLDLEISERVTYEELGNIYKKYAYFILPSVYEGNPKVLLEAMSNGCIVLASNIDNHNELIKNNKNGILFNLEKGSLKKELERINESEHLLGEISASAIQTSREHFSIINAMKMEKKDFTSLLNY